MQRVQHAPTVNDNDAPEFPLLATSKLARPGIASGFFTTLAALTKVYAAAVSPTPTYRRWIHT
jgi:hypothetical protein